MHLALADEEPAHHGDADRGADAAHQRVEAGGLVELVWPHAAEGDRGQRHEEQAHADAGDDARRGDGPGVGL